jgi:hypothetical protein
MRELSLNILDVAQNSISANASLIKVEINENTLKGEMRILIGDNGKGMTPEQIEKVTDPFYTTRTTRKVGMGIPLFKMAAEMTGGTFSILSQTNEGTKIIATFNTQSVDLTPLGDMGSTISLLIAMNTQIDFIYSHSVDDKEFTLQSTELKQILGDVPLNEPDVVEWVKAYIREQTQIIHGGILHENN